MEDRGTKTLFKTLPFIVLIVLGAILLVYASFTLGVCPNPGTCHRIFANELGVPGILAIVVGVVGLFWLFITKWSR